jgi:DNA-directed RNA polymerase specialized sigma24 family protein
MPSPSDIARARVRAALEADPTIVLTMLTFCLRRARGHRADAEDLSQTVLMKALDPAYKAWQPEETELMEFLGSILNGEARNAYRKELRRPVADVRPEDSGQIFAVARTDPESLLVMDDVAVRARDVFDALETALQGDAEALTVIDVLSRKTRGRGDGTLAERARLTPEAYRLARQRLTHKLTKIVEARPSSRARAAQSRRQAKEGAS